MLQTNCFYNKRRYFWLQGDVIGDKAGGGGAACMGDPRGVGGFFIDKIIENI